VAYVLSDEMKVIDLG